MIRQAVSDDLTNMLLLFKKQHASMGCDWEIKTAVLFDTFSKAIKSPENWLVLFGDECLLLAACFESPVGAGMVAQEICFCASPGNRDRVLSMYHEWARSKGCRTSSLSCVERPEVFARLYRKHGYALAETTFAKVL